MWVALPQDEPRIRDKRFEFEVITMFWTPEGHQAEIGYRYEQLRKAARAGHGRSHRAHHSRLGATLRSQLRLPGHPRRHLTAK